jgi:chromosome partitioning protein
MLVIAVLNSKGGVGKTTLSSWLAVWLVANTSYKRVGIVDYDPQGGAATWAEYRKRNNGAEAPEVLHGTDYASDIIEKLEATGWDVVVFDGPPGELERSVDAAEVADLVVIPMKPTAQDMDKSGPMINACFKRGVPYLVVLNEAVGSTDRRANEIREFLESAGHPVYSANIVSRVVHRDATSFGRIATEVKGAPKEAVQELDGFCEFVIKKAKASGKTRERRRG